MTSLEIVIIAVGGMASGFINTLAGGGSAITLPILTEIVGPNVANGTNRVAIQLANIAAVIGFTRGGKMQWDKVVPIIPFAIVGAGLGAYAATQLSADATRSVIGIVLILVAVSVLIRPSRWVEGREGQWPVWLRSLVFVALGFYGGFIQAGVGFMLLAALVFGVGFDLVTGNAAKVLLIATYTPIALFLFARAGQVDYAVGGVLAVGQVTGAWIAARMAIAKGAEWVRWILVVAALVAAGRLLFFS